MLGYIAKASSQRTRAKCTTSVTLLHHDACARFSFLASETRTLAAKPRRRRRRRLHTLPLLLTIAIELQPDKSTIP